MHGIERMKEIAVIGAAGKMGSGIALLLLQEMAAQEANASGFIGRSDYRLRLIDSSDEGLLALRNYLRKNLKKYAEQNIVEIRRWFAKNKELVDNEQMVEAFVEGSLDNVRFGTSLELAKGSKLVFEAIVEEVEIKSEVLAKIENWCGKETFYFSNTSSIPIEVLSKKAHIERRLIGFHFYNPPAIQKLIELIIPKETEPLLIKLAQEIAQRMKKTVVFSHDVAGFIGNGHFIREINFACQLVERLSSSYSRERAIYLVNQATQNFLLRPMGIFQLLDYVGLDVCVRIAKIMSTYLSGRNFDIHLIDEMVSKKVFGGQYPDGTQKDGFFQYEKGNPVAVYDLSHACYLPFTQGNWVEECKKLLGSVPLGLSWKSLTKDPQRQQKISQYFQQLSQEHSLGAELAIEFLQQSKKIAQLLINEGVTDRIEEVNQVLRLGFYHLYGVMEEPIGTAK